MHCRKKRLHSIYEMQSFLCTLECKFPYPRMQTQDMLEIIETYWNVNLGNKIRDGIVETEIIETYWNILKCK